MTGEQGDRRVRRTKAMLRAALTELLKTKPVNEISVTELTRKADVNRGTFYGHYKDIFDMVEQLENEMFQEFNDLLHAYPADALKHGLRPILRDVFEFLQRYGDVSAALLAGDRDTRFLEQLKGIDGEDAFGIDRIAFQQSGKLRIILCRPAADISGDGTAPLPV